MWVVRVVGAALLSIAAMVVFVAMAPDVESVQESSFAGQIALALDDYDANEDRTEGAPQQQVVNGWVARDLLSIMASQNDDLHNAVVAARQPVDDRPSALLTLGVLAICLFGATAGDQRSTAPTAAPRLPFGV